MTILTKKSHGEGMKTLSRMFLDSSVKEFLKTRELRTVLDVGAGISPYRSFIKCESYKTLDLGNLQADFTFDVHEVPETFYRKKFDLVIATEILEHCYDPVKVLSNIKRMVKPGGYLFLSTRFLYPHHINHYTRDYARFTKDFFVHKSDGENFKIILHGNTMHVIWELLCTKSRYLKVLNPLLFQFRRSGINCLGIVFIWKSRITKERKP